MKHRTLTGLLAAGLLWAGAVSPALASDNTNQTLGPDRDAAVQAMVQGTPDGFAAVAGHGLDGTTGGQGGRTVVVGTVAELAAFAISEEPLIIVLDGTLRSADYVKMPVASNKSLIGADGDAALVNAGFKLINVSNVIFRNFTIRDSYIPGDWDGKRSDNDRDGIQMDASHHVWIDHMAFFRLGDGMIDARKDSDYLSYSWNIFADHNKALGVGWTSNAVTHMTIHHNWIRNTFQRNASIDNTAAAHVYNNYLQDIGQYGMMGRNAAKVVVEGNYFQDVQDPVVAKDPQTQLVSRNNVFDGTRGRKDNTGTAFEPEAFYSYSMDAAASVPEVVGSGAGPVGRTPDSPEENLTVALDGTGEYASIQAAIGAVPVGDASRYTIKVKPGNYREMVHMWADRPGLTLRGVGRTPGQVVLSYDLAAGGAKFFGGTWGAAGSATLNVLGAGVTVRDITVENAYDEAANGGSQALAVRSVGDRVQFLGTRFLGNQDTFMADTAGRDATARTYLKGCYVEGDVDFIYGRGTAVFDKCTIHSLTRGSDTNNGYIGAPSTKNSNPYGILIANSSLTSDAPAGTVSLGRPWFASSDPDAHPQMVVRDSWLGAHIAVQGWADMSGHVWSEGRFAEFRNEGPGAQDNLFHPQLTKQDSKKFTIKDYLGNWRPRG